VLAFSHPNKTTCGANASCFLDGLGRNEDQTLFHRGLQSRLKMHFSRSMQLLRSETHSVTLSTAANSLKLGFITSTRTTVLTVRNDELALRIVATTLAFVSE
jgi:hypothetical protein